MLKFVKSGHKFLGRESFKNNRNSIRSMFGFIGKGKTVLFFLCFLYTFLALSGTASAKTFYTPVTAQIPFYTEKVSYNVYATYTIRIEDEKGGEPMPDTNSITVKAGETGCFNVTVTEPGTYVYRIYQEKGLSTDTHYDDKVYDVYLCVMNENNNNLSYMVSVLLSNSSTKPDKLSFVNTGSGNNPPIVVPPETPPTPVKGGGASSKTGENTGMLIAIYAGIMGLLVAGAVAYIVLKNRSKKLAGEPLTETVSTEESAENEDSTQ